MWENTQKDDRSDPDKYYEGFTTLIEVAQEHNSREHFEQPLLDFIHQVKMGNPIPDCLMQYTADTLERLLIGQNVHAVSDVMGSRSKGSKGRQSLEKKRAANRVAVEFAKHKLNGVSRAETIAKTAESCGVTERTVERIIREYAEGQPFYRY